MNLEAISEGCFKKVTLPAWSTVEDLSASQVALLCWLHGDNYNLFATMASLRETLWAHVSNRPKVALMVALIFDWQDAATILKCFHTDESIPLALGRFAQHLGELSSSSRGYVLCRALGADAKRFVYSYCRKVSNGYERDDFVDHLDRSGASKRVSHAFFGADKKPFVNLFNGFDARVLDDGFFQAPEER